MSRNKASMEEIQILDEISDVLADVSLSGCEAETKTESASSHKSIKPKELSKEEENWWEKLKLLQCPFNWDDLREIEMQDRATEKGKCRLSRIEEKMEEIDEYDTFQYRKFILSIVLVYEHFYYGDTGSVMSVLRETEALVASSSKLVGSLSEMIRDINDALYHVVLACRVYVQFNFHVLSDVERTFAKIILWDDMNDKCKAAISGIRAAVLMEYGYNGNIGAMKHIETALYVDPDQGEWHFLLGKCMGRMRRINATFQIPSKKELKSLEEAVKLTKNVAYIVFLAQAYREAAFRVYSEQRHNTTSANATRTIDKMNERSLVLYKEALELRSGCPHVRVRCAQGFMKLPHPYKDLARAKMCLEEALKHAPNNPMVNHTAAMFYEQHEKNFSEAKKYYERASELGAFGSYMDLIRVKYNENKYNYDPIPDLEISIKKKFLEHPYQQEATMQIGSYYLFIKDDIENAFKYWEKVINEDPESEKLKMHKCLFLRMLKPVNVYEVLCDESRLVLQLKPYKAKGNEAMYRRIIMKCTKNYPVCVTTSPIPRRKMVLVEVEEVERSRFRSKSRGRGRGGLRGRGGPGRGQRGGERGGGDRDQCVGEHGRDNSGGERGRGNRGGERGRGNRGGERGRGNRGGERGRGNRGGERGRGNNGGERGRGNNGGERGRGGRQGGSRGHYSRDSSTDSYYKDYSNERQGSDGDRGYHKNNPHDGHYSRDSTTDSYRRHHSNERWGLGIGRGDYPNSRTGAYCGRDYSGNRRYNEDKRSDFQKYRSGQGEYRRDSSAESMNSCGSAGYRYRDSNMGDNEQSWHGQNRGSRSGHGSRGPGNSYDHSDVKSNWRTVPRERKNSDSSTEGSMARKLNAGRVRTDSTSSVNSCPDEAKVNWGKGYRMSSSQGISEDFVNARNTYFRAQHSQLKKSQVGHRMWWSEQAEDD